MAEDNNPLKVRTHHLMCISRGAVTGGHHPTLTPLLQLIRKDPDRLITVVIGPDDICLPCPHWDGQKCNRSEGMEEKNARKDALFIEVLGLTEGDTHTARDFYDIIAERITLEALRQICPSCKPDECYPAAKDPSVIFGPKT